MEVKPPWPKWMQERERVYADLRQPSWGPDRRGIEASAQYSLVYLLSDLEVSWLRGEFCGLVGVQGSVETRVRGPRPRCKPSGRTPSTLKRKPRALKASGQGTSCFHMVVVVVIVVITLASSSSQ